MEKKKGKKNKIEEQLEECQRIKEEYLANWKRERADFLNYKKEEKDRTIELIKYANEDLILKLLPILDNLFIAEKEIPEDLRDDKWVEGFLKIKTQILDFLKNQGLKEIESLGKKFDPNFQEAVEIVKKGGYEPEIVVEEIKKGYLLNDKVIRPAKVKISK